MRKEAVPTFVIVAIFVSSLLYFAVVNRKFSLDTDDAYITYRYAQNLADGAGFVYNPNERVMGTTTPLFTFVLAAAAGLGIPIPTASAAVGIVSSALVVAIVAIWLFQLTGSSIIAIASGGLLLVVPKFVIFSLSGMETGLYALTIVASFYLYDRGRLSAAAVTAATAALVRLDGVAVGAALFLHFVATRRKLPPLKVLGAYALPMVPWLCFAWLYFGNVLPQSMLAKHQHPLMAERWWMPAFCMGPEALPFWPLAILAIVTPMARRMAGPAGLQALALWVVSYVAAFTIYRIDLYQWYLAPLLVALVILSAAGVASIFRVTEATAASQTRGLSLNAIGCVLVMAPLVIAGWERTSNDVSAMVDWTNTVERARMQAAEQIRRETQPGDVIATGAIGIVGWTTRSPVFDTMALVTPAAVGLKGSEAVERSHATWFITETNQLHAPAPSVRNFALAGAFNRDATPTFLLYRRVASSPPVTAANQQLRTVAGLTIESVSLQADRLEVALSAAQAQTHNYKFFVHLNETGRDDDTITRQADFYPVIPTSQMTAGARSTNGTAIVPPLSAPVTIVRLGLFDESDPAFTRLTDADGRSMIVLQFPER